MGQLQSIEAQLAELGVQVIAISPDTPANLQPTVEKNELGYRLFSDSSMAAARAFGIAFKVDQETIDRYAKFGIDLEAASGQSHFELPVPAVFVYKKGSLSFQYVNPDYRVRLSGELVLAAARDAAE